MTLDWKKINDNGIQGVGTGDSGDSSLLWSSYRSSAKSSEDTTESNKIASQVTDVVNNTHRQITQNKNFVPASDSAFKKSIWRNMDANTFFNNSPQKAIEQLMNLKAGDNLLMFDMETLGTMNGGKKDRLKWYTPTEIGLVHSVFNADGSVTVQQGPNASKSLLVRPDSGVYSEIQKLLGDLKGSQGRSWKNFSDDQRRSLSDLVLYAGGEKELFDKSGGVTYVKKQMRSLMPLTGSVLSDPTMIGRMEMGLNNLWTHGNDIGTLAQEMNSMIADIKKKTKQDIKIGGYNIHAFDIPVFQDYINSGLAKDNQDSKVTKALQTLKSTVNSVDHIDVYAGINTLYTDGLQRFGMNKKLEHLINKYGLTRQDGISHMAAYDAEMTAHLFGHLMKSGGMNNFIQDIKKSKKGSWNLGNMQVGDKFFAHSGATGGKHDAVYRLNEQTQMLEQAYSIRGNGNQVSLYKNAAYTVHGMYEGLNLPGSNSKHFGLLLKNEDDGLFHFLARDKFEDVQNLIHKNLSFIGDAQSGAKGDKYAHAFSNKDRALRHYSRMFSDEGGVGLIERTYSALDAMDRGQSKAEVMKAGGWMQDGKPISATEEFYRNLDILAPRLREERSTTMAMVNRIKNDPILGKVNNKGWADREAQGLALQNFRRHMDGAFGANKSETSVGGRGAITVQMDGKERIVTLNTREAIKGQLRSLVTSGHTSADDMSNHVIKGRLLSLANQVKAGGGLRGKRGISGSELNRIISNINQLGDKESFNGITEYLGNLLYEINGRHQELGLKKVNIEDPTQVVDYRKAAIMDGETGFHVRGQAIMDRSVTEASSVMGYGTKNGRLNIIGDSGMKLVTKAHDLGVNEMLRKSGIIDGRGKYRTTGIGEATPMSQKLSELANAFTYGDQMEVALLYHGEKKGLSMAIVNKADAERIFKLSPNEIIESNKAAIVSIPTIDSKGHMVLPGQERMARMKVLRHRDGGYSIGTGFDEIINSLKGKGVVDRVAAMMANGDAIGTQNWLGSVVRKSAQKLSMNNSRQSLDGEDFFRVTQETSKAARWTRGGVVDISDFAEEWFQSHYAGNAGEARYREIKSMQTERRTSFTDTMRFGERMQFQRNIDQFVKDRYKLNLDVHSIKDTHVSQYLRSSRDIRELTPFGYMNPMARENIMKSVNYLPMEEQVVREKLAKHFTPEEVERRMTRRFTTDTAHQVLQGETGYLNLRAAYLNDKQLTDMMGEKGISNARVTTYDGMFMIADDVASAYTTKREKAIRMDKNSVLHEKIGSLFGENFDFANQSMEFADKRTLAELGFSTENGKAFLTVGKVAAEAYSDPQELRNVTVKGWDHQRRALVLEKTEVMANGFKGITDAGDRITAVIVPRAIFNKLGIDADVILDPMNASRRQFGSEVNKAVNLVLDEAFRQGAQMVNGQVTVGKLQGKEVLGEVQNMLERNFGIKGHVDIQDGKLVMSSKFGMNGETVAPSSLLRFLDDAGSWLGKDFANGKINYGNVGLGVADVYNWENSFGVSDNEGLVRWGIKEQSVIQSRLDRYATSGTIGKDSAVGAWLKDISKDLDRTGRADAEKYTRGILSTIRTYGDRAISSNDIVIRTSGSVFDPLGDKEGRTTGRVAAQGHFEISMHAFNDLPGSSTKGQTFSPGDYNKTIVSMGDLEINRMMENGSVRDWNKSFKDMMHDASRGSQAGTVLFELPDDTFSHKHVRFIDTEMNKHASMPIMQELQKSQMKIWRYTQEYLKDGEVARDNLQGAINEYHDKAAHVLGGSHDGSVVRNLMSADMNMSGRFRIQSVNPFESAKGSDYQELTTYVSEGRMKEMIGGSETDIAKALNIDISEHNWNTSAGKSAIEAKVLAHVKQNGLYGFTGRYPSINEDTIQVMKIAVDKNMAYGDRQAMVTAGTAIKLKADFDGDFLSTVLSHYRGRDASRIHEELGSIWSKDKVAMDEIGAQQTAKLEADWMKSGSGVSLGKIMSATERDADQTLYNLKTQYFEDWKSRVSALDGRESLEARLGKSYIGQISNTGLKLRTLTDATLDIAGTSGVEGYGPQDIQRKRALVGELSRMLEQDLISSKKFNVEDIRANLAVGERTDENVIKTLDERVGALQLMMDGLKNPSQDGINKIMVADKYLTVLKDGNIRDGSGDYVKASVKDMLDVVQEVHKLNGGGPNMLGNKYLGLGTSGSSGIDDLSKMMQGTGDMPVGTGLVKELADVDDQMREMLAQGQEGHRASVLGNLKNMVSGGYGNDPFASLLGGGGITELSEMMDGTVADKASGQFRQIAGKFMGGMGGSGAGGLTAIKAAGGMFAGLWGASALMRGGPTPEETIRGKDGAIEDGGPPRGSAMGMVKNPTARVTPQGENINIQINAKDASRMDNQQIAALVQNELVGMMPMQMNMNTTVHDNTTNIDQQYLQGIVAQALSGRII
jgi:hypothetical protein